MSEKMTYSGLICIKVNMLILDARLGKLNSQVFEFVGWERKVLEVTYYSILMTFGISNIIKNLNFNPKHNNSNTLHILSQSAHSCFFLVFS
jgi:hypothetical protein